MAPFSKQSGLRAIPPLLACTLMLTACSCSTTSTKSEPTWSCVAAISGNDKPLQEIVRATLRKSNIECYFEGSLIYGVMVPTNQRKQARQAIKGEPRLGPPHVKIIDRDEILRH
jgi:tRNA A37 threonylcarbamoyladenosine dehydratase